LTAAQLSTLRTAEDAATAAQARLAKLHAVQREIFAAMVSAGNARAAEMLDPEDMKLFGFEGLSELAAKAALLAMDDLVTIASDDAGKAADYVDDLIDEVRDGRSTAFRLAAE
jgi:hypothetical protein